MVQGFFQVMTIEFGYCCVWCLYKKFLMYNWSLRNTFNTENTVNKVEIREEGCLAQTYRLQGKMLCIHAFYFQSIKA